MQGQDRGEGIVSSSGPTPVATSETGRVLRPQVGLFARAGRILLTWGTPIAIGLFLGSVASRSSRPASASTSVQVQLPPR
jgi:hypothetical protein